MRGISNNMFHKMIRQFTAQSVMWNRDSARIEKNHTTDAIAFRKIQTESPHT
jgi:hypothetical protein